MKADRIEQRIRDAEFRIKEFVGLAGKVPLPNGGHAVWAVFQYPETKPSQIEVNHE